MQEFKNFKETSSEPLTEDLAIMVNEVLEILKKEKVSVKGAINRVISYMGGFYGLTEEEKREERKKLFFRLVAELKKRKISPTQKKSKRLKTGVTQARRKKEKSIIKPYMIREAEMKKLAEERRAGQNYQDSDLE